MKKLILTAIILTLTGLVIYFALDKQNTNKEQVAEVASMKITQFNIDGRAILKQSDNIYVGNNIKELENNFYDIKITNTKEGVVIYLNKLWYEDYGLDYIQDEYLARICRELSLRLDVEADSQQFEYLLYKYIKDNYMKVRQNENVEIIMTDKLTLNLELEDNIVKLVIKRSN